MKNSVLILSPFFSPNIGGVETHLNDLVNYLADKRVNTYVITYKPLTTRVKEYLSYEKKPYVEIRRLWWFGHNWFHKFESKPVIQFLYLTPYFLFYTLFFLLIHHRQVKTIHAHGLTAALVAKAAKSLFNIRVVTSMQAIYNLDKNPKLAEKVGWVLKSSDQLLALADLSRQDLLAAGVNDSKIKIFTHWVDQNSYRPQDKIKCRETLGLNHKFIVLFVGRLIEKKGVRVLVELSKQLPSDIAIVIMGDNGPLNPEVTQAAKTQPNLFLYDRISGKEIIPYFGACDLVAQPSQYEEGFSRVVLETLSCGRPIIAANKGCLPGMITSEVGRLIEPTVENYKDVILDFYYNPDKLQELTKNCRRYAEERFSQKNADFILESYELYS